MGAEKKKKWNLYDAMSFLDPFTGNFEAASNLETFDRQEDPQSPSNQSQISEQGEIAMSQEQPQYTKRQPSKEMKKTIGRGKRESGSSIDMEVLRALKEPENEDDADVLWWKGLKPMLSELDPIESLKFKHEVTGLLLTYVERAKTRTAAASSSFSGTFSNSPSPLTPTATSTHREGYSAVGIQPPSRSVTSPSTRSSNIVHDYYQYYTAT